MRPHPSFYRLLPLFLLSLNSLPAGTVGAELAVRGNCCSGGDVDDDHNCIPDPDDAGDEATDDKDAGIGFEFECGNVMLEPIGGCSQDQIDKLKGHVLAGRTGTNWKLTADTTAEEIVDIEYILDGKNIKLGSGDLKTAAEAAGSDVLAWDPYKTMPDNSWEIEGIDCKWEVTNPENSGDVGNGNICRFAPQATAPMPLEAIQDLFGKATTRPQGKTYALLPGPQQKNLVYVTKDFFQASSPPGGLQGDSLKDDVLGFFSLVVSYAKANKCPEDEDPTECRSSIKDLTTSIMPRNDFTSMYKLLKTQNAMPSIQGSLWDLVATLSCYKNSGSNVVYDTTFCDGNDLKNPKPKDGFLENRKYERGSDSCTMKDFIQDIEGGTSPDAISRVDKQIDGSVGRFGDHFEKVMNTDREVPIFEFRRLKGSTPSEFGTLASGVEDAIMDYHKSMGNAPRKLRKKQNAKYSHIKRDGASNACVTQTPTPTSSQNSQNSTITPPPTTAAPSMPSCSMQNEDPDQGIDARGCVCGSMTLPLLTISNPVHDSDSCSYTAMPSSSVANPITVESQTFTNNCYLCTLVGGIADTPSCASTPVSGCTPTTPAVPTATVFLSNNSIPIGDENNKNNGTDLRNELFKQLQQLCPDTLSGKDGKGNAYGACDTTKPAEIDHVETVVGDEPGEETLKFTISDSMYYSTKERDQLIAIAVSSWQQAVAKSCKEVDYEDTEDPTASGCGTGIVKRALMTPEERRLNPRSPAPAPICDNCNPPPAAECHYKATICSGPNHITSIVGNNQYGPYANHLSIGMTWEIEHGESAFDEFICELIIDALSALAMAVAPELIGPEVLEDLELQALCGSLEDQPEKRGVNVTDNALLIGGY